MGLNGFNIGRFETRSQQVNDSKREQINHEKFGCELIRTPPSLFAASISTSLAVFVLISSLLFTGKSRVTPPTY
jgi:hypothetical protein